MHVKIPGRTGFCRRFGSCSRLECCRNLILAASLDLGAGLEFSAGLELATDAVMPSKCAQCQFEFVNIHVRAGFSYMSVHLLQACT